ncbi:MAG TPA: TonB family protein [Myxococcota bacterium]|nr:TonB family protein [Myxococcota bacterium]HQK50799.1 TonB family protein [Myxococcota bacterium]
MQIGLLIAVVGALVGLIGGLSVPWVDSEVVRFTDETLFQGVAWWDGILSMILTAVGLACAGIALATHRKKPLATAGLVAAGLSFVFLFLVPFTVRSEMLAMVQQGTMKAHTQLAMFYGYHLMFLGIVVQVVGFVWTLSAQPILGPDDRLLRVALLWDGKIIKETTFTEKRDITIGEAVSCDFIVPDPAVGRSLALFRFDKKGMYQVALSRDFQGRVNLDNLLLPIRDYVKKHTSDASGLNYVNVQKGDWGVFEFGKREVFFQFVRPDVIIGRSTAMSMDGNFIAATVGSLFVLVSLWVYSQFAWDPTQKVEQRPAERRLLKVEANVTMEKEETLLEIGEEDDSVGKRAEGEEGKFGDPDKDPNLESKVPRRDGALAARIDPKKVGLADLLSNRMGQSGAISSILSDNADAFENRMAVAMAGTGSELVVGYGAGGMGFKGTGPGGGGTGGYGRIHGLGRVDTGGGMGMRAGLGKKGTKSVGKMSLGGMGATGFCQRNNIQAVVMQRAGAIRACYEQQLQIYESLAGKVSVRWTIDLEGRVSDATVVDSSLGNDAVVQCVLRTIRNMRFAKPEGGICVVQWPFVFNPG